MNERDLILLGWDQWDIWPEFEISCYRYTFRDKATGLTLAEYYCAPRERLWIDARDHRILDAQVIRSTVYKGYGPAEEVEIDHPPQFRNWLYGGLEDAFFVQPIAH